MIRTIFYYCPVIYFLFGEFCIIIILNTNISENHIDVNGQSSTKLVIGFLLILTDNGGFCLDALCNCRRSGYGSGTSDPADTGEF